MTTPWSKPQSCTWTYNIDQETQRGAIAFLDIEPIVNATSLSCYPDGMISPGRTGIYSPGTCPSGWTTVSVTRNTNQPKAFATTTAICCSSEYSLDGQYCKRSMATLLAIPITYNLTDSTYDIFHGETSTLLSGTLAVHTIRALFREEDKATLGLTDDTAFDDENIPAGLSLSAKIGIGVGVSLAGLLFIGILTFFLTGKHRKSNKKWREPTHELGRVDRNPTGSHQIYGNDSRGTGDLPPLAYEVSIETDSGHEGEEIDANARADEIVRLRAQKAAIQRRIEELESPETDGDSRGGK